MIKQRPLHFFALLLSLLCVPVITPAQEHALDAASLEFFEKQVRPVLIARCYKCHSEEEKKKGGLLLDSKAGWMAGGDSGQAIVAGKAEKSLLIEAIRYKNEFVQMPPKGKLPDHEIEALVKWVEMGAPDPRIGKKPQPEPQAIDIEKGRAFWSYQPIAHPTPPNHESDRWSRGNIDRFIYARLAEQQLAPAKDASRHTLIRRAYLDLIGLPPTTEQIDAFVNDTSPDAFAKIVDELLASQHFGERWGRHWLDISRYAESSGGGRTLIFNNAWRFRDYVIDSFNDDKPYDQFVREQIAGDLMSYDTPEQRADQLTGSGYLMLGAINYELQDKELLRMEVIDEQIHTMGRTFLGMTLGCARCHDHKFDPIPTADYYALAGIFRSTRSLTAGINAGVSRFVETELPLPPDKLAKREKIQPGIAVLREQLDQAKATLKQSQSQLSRLSGKSVNDQLTASSAIPGIVIDDEMAKLQGKWTKSTSVKRYIDKGYQHTLGGTNASATFSANLPSPGEYEVRVAYSESQNRTTRLPVEIRHANGYATKNIDQQQTPGLDGHFVSLGTFPFEDKALVKIDAKKVAGTVIIDAIQLLPVVSDKRAKQEIESDDQPRDLAEIAALKDEVQDLKETVKALESELKAMQQNLPKAEKVMSVAEHSEIGDYHICIRGNAHQLGDRVERGFLQVVTPKGQSARPESITDDQSGRLQLADWLASPNNPLTARVMVNRIWLHLMGEGIVRTPDNFGVPGDRPTHPMLLDHLATQFIADGWSIKKTIRSIMLSRTYQMSSDGSSDAALADAENMLLHRAHTKRLDAEVIRDVMLSVSGQLDTTPGGSSMRPGTKTGVNYKFNSIRRSVYVPVFRNTVDPLFDAFDFANPNVVTGQRTTSTLPTQALYMMNSPFVQEQASAAAERLLAMDAADDTERLTILYRQALGRKPTDAEIRITLKFLSSTIQQDDKDAAQQRLDAWSGVVQNLFASLDFRYQY